MRKINRPLLKGTNWALVGILSLLGFSGCDKIGADEYGQPYTEFTLKGKVTDPSGKGIPNIEIKTKTGYDFNNQPYEAGTTKTNIQGEYNITIDTFNKQKIGLFAEDIDGEINGSYEADSVFIPKEDITLKDAKGWFNGRGSKEVNFSLKEREK